MLATMRNSWLLFLLAALVALSTAFDIEGAIGVGEYLHYGERRQVSGTGNSDAPPSTSNNPPPSSNPPPRTSTPPSPSPIPSTTNVPNEPSSQAPSETLEPSNPPPATSNPRTSQTPTATVSTSQTPSRTSAITTPIVKSSPLVATSVNLFTTIFTTVSNGQNIELTSTGASTALITTGTAVTTELPLPQNQNGESSGSLSDSNKKIIGGVVGGVGGAILLGGIAIVCWRIWGRKKRVTEDDDDLVAGTGAALGDKSHAPNQGTPFQSNLEQYHTPGGRPNAAANF